VQPRPPAYAKATAGEPGADHAVLPTAKGSSERSELEPEIARKPRRRRYQVVVPKKPDFQMEQRETIVERYGLP
jgi:hypothetical protein